VVLVDMLGVVNVVTPVPPATGDPPVLAMYQSSVAPDEAVPAKATVPAPHRAAEVVEATVGIAFTLARTAVLPVDVQPEVAFRASA
jgi:hypothetical protein